MRKFLSILFLVIYVLSTSGVVFAKHFCGNELEKVNLFAKANCCGDCEDEITTKDDGCCKDEYKYSRINDNQLAEKRFCIDLSNFWDYEIPSVYKTDFKVTSSFVTNYNITSTNTFYNYKNKLYLRFCQLVFYA